MTKSPERVLVGKDQDQHIELTRKISNRLNLVPFEIINTYKVHHVISVGVMSEAYLILPRK